MMKNRNAFLKFLNKPSLSEDNLLNEDLVILRNEQYEALSVDDLLKLAEYSPDWDDSMKECRVTFEFTAEQLAGAQERIQQFIGEETDLSNKYSFSVKNGGGMQLLVNVPPQKMGLFGKTLAQRNLRPSEKPKKNPNGMLYSGDLTFLKNVFLIQNAVVKDQDPNTVKLLDGDQELPDDLKKDFDAAVVAPKTQIIVQAADIDAAEFVYNYIQNGPEAAENGLSQQSKKDFYSKLTVMEQISDKTKFVLNLGYNEVFKNHKSLEEVLSAFDEAQISRNIQVYQNRQKAAISEQLSLENAEREAKGEKPLSKKDLQKRIEDIASKTMKNIFQIKSLDEFKEAINPKKENTEDAEALEKRLYHEEVHPTNPCAKRRMKLFEDLKTIDTRKPAKIFSAGNWIVSITYTPQQNHVFGRYKPKVDEQGNILEQCNKRDDEGITSENKRIRDSTSHRYIKDNLPAGANDQAWEANWCTAGCDRWGGTGDSGWSHVNRSSHWSGYGSKHGHCQIMNLQTGELYQYARYEDGSLGGFLYEQEHNSSNAPLTRGGDGEASIRRAKSTYPDLKRLLERVEKLWGNDPEEEIKDAFEYAKRNNLLTKNNRLKITQPDDIKYTKALFGEIGGLIITTASKPYLRSLFAGKQFDILPPIDLINVIDGGEMFYKTVVGNSEAPGAIVLRNTQNLTSMKDMFNNARASKVVGINTRNATDMSGAFRDFANPKLTQFVEIPELDLRSCTNLDNAFMHCSARKIALSNPTSKVKSARAAFVDCYALEKIPTLIQIDKATKEPKKTFEGISHISMLCSGMAMSNAEEIFDGCSTLHTLPEFDETCKQIQKAYETDREQYEKGETNEQGFLIIRNFDDAHRLASSMDDYPGVYIDSEDATTLFEGLDVRLKVLDMSKVKVATKMFYRATIMKLQKFVGLENVSSADKMFEKCKCNLYPDLDFSGLGGQFSVFYDSYPSRETKFPKVKVGGNVDLGVEDLIDIKASNPDLDDLAVQERFHDACKRKMNQLLGDGGFGSDEYGYTAWENTHHEDRIADWYKSIIAQVGVILDGQLKSLQKDDKDYLKVPSTNLLKRLLKNPEVLSEYKGIRIDNANASGMFAGMRCQPGVKIPPIDMSQVRTANSMFEGFCGAISEFESADNLIEANAMFENAVLSEIPEFSVERIVNGESMFENVRIAGGSSRFPEDMMNFRSLVNGRHMFEHSNTSATKLQFNLSEASFPALQDGTSMFYGCDIICDEFDFPALQTAELMFIKAGIETNSGNMTQIKCPQVTNAEKMFKEVQFTSGIQKCLLPRATNCRALFSHSRGIEYIGNLDIRACSQMEYIFLECRHLKLIAVKRFPRGQNFASQKAFKDCPLHVIYGNNAEKIKDKNRLYNRI